MFYCVKCWDDSGRGRHKGGTLSGEVIQGEEYSGEVIQGGIMQKYRGRGSGDWCKVIWGETGRECKAKALHWTQNRVSCSVSNCTNNTATTCRRREVGGWGDPLGEPKWLAGVNKWDLKTTCRNKYLASVDSVRDKRDNQQHIKAWIYFPLFIRHFSMVSSQFGPNLGGEWCHQPRGGFHSRRVRKTLNLGESPSASLTHNRSSLQRLFFEQYHIIPYNTHEAIIVPVHQDYSWVGGDNLHGIFPCCGDCWLYRKLTLIYFDVFLWCFEVADAFVSDCQMMNGAIFGQKQADLKYVTDSLAFAHIAMNCLLFLLITPVSFGM